MLLMMVGELSGLSVGRYGRSGSGKARKVRIKLSGF